MRAQRLAEQGWKMLNTVEQRLRISKITENNTNVILKFHSIGSHSYGDQKLSQFASNIEYLATHYSIERLTEVVMSEDSNKKQIALTFDDGYADFYQDVYPVLKKYEVPATVFVIGSALTEEYEFSDISKFNSKHFMTRSQIKELVKSNLVQIGAHTMTHPFLSELSSEKQHQEIYEGKNYLESIFGIEIETFCYPFGDYADETVEIADRYFDIAVTSDNGLVESNENVIRVPRVPGNQDKIALNITDVGHRMKRYGSSFLANSGRVETASY